MKALFPELKNISGTVKVLKSYAEALSFVKGVLTPHQKSWEEFSLKIYAKGLTTTPVPCETENQTEALDLNLNFNEHKLKIFAGKLKDEIDLKGANQAAFVNELKIKLARAGVSIDFPEDKFGSTDKLEYNREKVESYWQALRHIYFVFLEFKGGILNETSNINFWTHHFDLAMLWFSGRIIEGQDPGNWDYSREQMNFGFSAGDAGIRQPYFYVTAYPFPEDAAEIDLPGAAYWHSSGWNGAVLKYADLLKEDSPGKCLLDFWKLVLDSVSSKMD